MKMSDAIETLLYRFMYNYDEDSGCWVKDDWRVRIFVDDVEVFEIKERGGRYLKFPLDLESLEEVLEETTQ